MAQTPEGVWKLQEAKANNTRTLRSGPGFSTFLKAEILLLIQYKQIKCKQDQQRWQTWKEKKD